MASILDTAVLFGKESTYATAATLTRGYEAKNDSFQRAQEYLSSRGFRGGMHTQLSTRSVPINMGGTGSVEVDVQPTGFGLMLQSMLGNVTGPTQVAATAAYLQTFETTATGPEDSWTIQVAIPDVGGTVRAKTFLGCMMTGWSLTQARDGLLGVTWNYDAANDVTNVAAGTPAYVDSLPYAWTQCAATWDGNAVDLTSFQLDAALALKTDRRFLRGSAVKKKPLRSAIPDFTGTAEMEFESFDIYDDFVSGATAPLVVTWTGANIEGANDFFLRVTMPAVQLQGESPTANLDDVPMQNLPFRVLWNGTDPAVKIEYQSTDAAL